MAESEVPVYATNEHFQGPDAHNAEQTRAEMVSTQALRARTGGYPAMCMGAKQTGVISCLG